MVVAAEEEILIEPGDFKSIRIVISRLTNHTAGTELKDGMRMIEGKNAKKDRKDTNLEINFLEFLEGKEDHEEGVILDVPPNTCAEGHNITIQLNTLNAKADVKLELMGKVVNYEALDQKRGKVVLELTQYDKKSWTALQNIFSSRQAEILEFFQAVKG